MDIYLLVKKVKSSFGSLFSPRASILLKVYFEVYREVVESPSLEIFKTRLDKVLYSLL